MTIKTKSKLETSNKIDVSGFDFSHNQMDFLTIFWYNKMM